MSNKQEVAFLRRKLADAKDRGAEVEVRDLKQRIDRCIYQREKNRCAAALRTSKSTFRRTVG